jgi:ketosteroid isomerase-like protein
MDDVAGLGERFYRAFLVADEDALSEVVDEAAVFVVRLDTLLSGAHRGPQGIAELRRTIDRLTGGTWRPLRDDSFDVVVSPWHAVIVDRFLAERDGRRLDSHEAIVVAHEGGRIVRLFHYLHDPDGFAQFWSR